MLWPCGTLRDPACRPGFPAYIELSVASLPAPCDTRHEGAPAALSSPGLRYFVPSLLGDYLVQLERRLVARGPLGLRRGPPLAARIEGQFEFAEQAHDLVERRGVACIRQSAVRALVDLVDGG